MTHWWTVFGPVLAIFGVIAIGTVLRRLDWLTEEADQTLLRMVINVLVPCLIFSTILGNPALHDPRNVWLPPLVGFGTTVLGFGAGLAFAKLLGRFVGLTARAEVATFAFCVGMYNYGYLAIPLVQEMYHAQPAVEQATLGVLFVHNVGVDLAMFSVGLAILAGRAGGWRSVLNVPTVSIVVALVLNLFDWSFLPGFLRGALATGVGMLGDCAIPMALLLIGATIGDHLPALRVGRGAGVLVSSLLLRLGLLPAAFLALAIVLPASPELKRVICVQAAMPSAVLPIVLARHYGGDVPTALRVVLGTSLVALVTIPIWIAVGARLVPT